ncbi:nucleotidyltransferase [Caulobacter sp. X]|jgi:protein ImuB|uniref:DNA-directed DNA polymerase n=3 Tax=Caulobacteraceae TaxID=76892 RepID=R0E7W4_CAUVI|nr:nucleotidyltransferase/DNA polymerase involved in DNA repair [Caulobacter vibrioides OR37]PIB96971.1 nucleotidyltransferase [Caulobacter sp. X]
MQGKAAPSPDIPVVMVGRVGRRRAIAHMNLAAAKAGLRLGQAVAHATAMVPGLVLHDLDAAGDDAALQRLALWAQRLYSPTVAPDPPDGLVIDATGCTHLFGGEEKMLVNIRQRLAKAGYTATLAIADSWGGAHALARYSRRSVFVVPPGALGVQLRDLPVAALRLPPDLVQALAKPGFDTIGELEATATGPLAHRFGLEPIRRLDQAFAREREPIEPVFAPETPRAAKIFAEPIGAPETMARYLTELTVELCATLEALNLGAKSIDAWFYRVDNRIESARIGLSTPARDARRLAKLLCEKLEMVDPGFGVDKMVLAAPGAEPLAYRQDEARLGGDKPAVADLAGLIDTLAARLGPDSVYRLASAESDIPERSVRKAPAIERPVAYSWPVDWPRPTRFFPRPEPIETVALLPDQPPAFFTWRGSRRRVRRADGPERVFGEWWRADAELARSRDYFQVEDEGGQRYWIYRDGDGEDAATGSQRWFMAGVFG